MVSEMKQLKTVQSFEYFYYFFFILFLRKGGFFYFGYFSNNFLLYQISSFHDANL